MMVNFQWDSVIVAHRRVGQIPIRQFPVSHRDSDTSRWPMKLGSQLYFNTGLIKSILGIFPHPYQSKLKILTLIKHITHTFPKNIQEHSLGFHIDNPNKSRFNHGFSKQIKDLESPSHRHQEASFRFLDRGTWGLS